MYCILFWLSDGRGTAGFCPATFSFSFKTSSPSTCVLASIAWKHSPGSTQEGERRFSTFYWTASCYQGLRSFWLWHYVIIYDAITLKPPPLTRKIPITPYQYIVALPIFRTHLPFDVHTNLGYQMWNGSPVFRNVGVASSEKYWPHTRSSRLHW